MVVARGVNRRQVIRLAPRVIKGTHTDAPEASFIDGRRFTIEMEKPMPVEADGEIRYTEARRLEIEILAGALPVLA
jgi:diacylglycerol kinase family enzyme